MLMANEGVAHHCRKRFKFQSAFAFRLAARRVDVTDVAVDGQLPCKLCGVAAQKLRRAITYVCTYVG